MIPKIINKTLMSEFAFRMSFVYFSAKCKLQPGDLFSNQDPDPKLKRGHYQHSTGPFLKKNNGMDSEHKHTAQKLTNMSQCTHTHTHTHSQPPSVWASEDYVSAADQYNKKSLFVT